MLLSFDAMPLRGSEADQDHQNCIGQASAYKLQIEPKAVNWRAPALLMPYRTQIFWLLEMLSQQIREIRP